MILTENRWPVFQDHAGFGLLRENAKSPDGPGKAYIEGDADDVSGLPAKTEEPDSRPCQAEVDGHRPPDRGRPAFGV